MILAMSYARALLETAQEQKSSDAELQKMESGLEAFAQALASSKDLRIALTGPAASLKEKAEVTRAIGKKLGIDGLLEKFLVLMAMKDRLGEMADVAQALTLARIESEGGVLGTVDSADPMDKADLDSVARSFTQKLGKKVTFRTSVNPELLAGIKVTVSGVTYDGTLRSQLDRLRDRLVSGTV